MSLTLYFHPFSSYCQKVLTALYENDTPFSPHVVDLMDAAEGAALRKLWPIGKFPVLRDEAADLTIPESSIIIEYLAQRYPGGTALLPADPDAAREARFRDRFFDLHVHEHVQKIVFDRLRPPDAKDPFGVALAKTKLGIAYGILETDMASRTWATGDDFTIADCAAAPALFYANLLLPFTETHKSVAAYLDRLMNRPAFARVVREAEPYRSLFPKE
jgi:glutathione S-transferase